MVVKCRICGKECNALGSHVRIHNLTIKEYRNLYPDAETISEESRKNYGSASKKNWDNPEIRKSQLERLKSYSNSEENKERLRKHNRDSKFIESQKERLSKLASDTNRRLWESDYDACRERATKNALWAARTSCVTKIQIKVADYLKDKGIKYSLEKYFTVNGRRVRVDIYLEELDLIIEVNGNYWHGKPGTPLEEMTRYQRQGYERDRYKESIFEDKLLFLWEEDIHSGKYESQIDEFIAIGHVKSGELLET